jgi:hypothetical protein
MSSDKKLAFGMRRWNKKYALWEYMFIPVEEISDGGSEKIINLNLPGNNERSIFGSGSSNIYLDLGWKPMELQVSGVAIDLFPEDFSDLSPSTDGGITKLYDFGDNDQHYYAFQGNLILPPPPAFPPGTAVENWQYVSLNRTHGPIKGRDVAAKLKLWWATWFRGYWSNHQILFPNWCSSGEPPFPFLSGWKHAADSNKVKSRFIRIDGVEYTVFEGRMGMPKLRYKATQPDDVKFDFPVKIGSV